MKYHALFRYKLAAPALLTAVALILSSCDAQSSAERQSHVLVIGVDGMSPDGIENANTPHLDRLIDRGAHSFRARSVMPSSSSSNWASMIMAAGPEQHGVTSNDWEPDDHILPPICAGSDGMFPTVFSAVRAQRPGGVIGVFHDWGGFGRLFERNVPDEVYDGDGPDDTVEHAAAFVREQLPLLTFVHLDHVDGAGHSEGHGSDAYYRAVEHADSLIGVLVAAVENAGLLENTTIIVSADHGGDGTGHGGVTPDEMEIPWIVAGPTVRSGFAIEEPIDTYDTAATVASLLGVTPHDCWIARPVQTAFTN